MKRLTGTASNLSNSVHQRVSKDALVSGTRVHKLCAFLISLPRSWSSVCSPLPSTLLPVRNPGRKWLS